VVNARVKRYRDLNGRHLAVLDQAEVNNDTVDLQVETTQSHVRVALAARTRLLRDGQTVEAGRRLVAEPGFVAHKLAVSLEQGGRRQWRRWSPSPPPETAPSPRAAPTPT
jgi:hypothetical protein